MTKKLPRRTVSMSKRASAVAEEAADLDLVEEVIGTEDERPRDYKTVLAGFGMAIAFLLITIALIRIVFPAVNVNHSMLPEGYQESVGLITDTQAPAMPVVGGGATTPSVQRGSTSPFPDPVGEMPIILAVDCPVGSVEIATGAYAADTVCVRGIVVDDAPASQPVPTAPAQPVPTASSPPSSLPRTGR